MSRLEFFQKDFKLDINFRYVSILLSKGSVPEWLKGADCKSAAGYATLVRIQLGPI